MSVVQILIVVNHKSNVMSVFNPILTNYIECFLSENKIDRSRIELLNNLTDYLIEKIQRNENVNLIFICTHNSRRSHLAHIWAHTAILHYNLQNIQTFSGGTEESAFNIRAVSALIRAGFQIENLDTSKFANQHYLIRFDDEKNNLSMFSKVYDHKANPKENFAAVMVCSHADENCPFIPGAEKRFSIPYDDPKDFDDTELEAEKYNERCLEIAKEMFYVFERINTK